MEADLRRAPSMPEDPADILVDRFTRVLGDVEWVRLITWEAAQGGERPVPRERERCATITKYVTALRTAEVIVQKREEVKSLAVESARRKIGPILTIEDLVIEDINLTSALENAIEAKMVQEQEAARARFAQQQAQTEANTATIKARGEAESITLRGRALRENPGVLDLQIIEHWDGVAPQVVGPGVSGANMLLPLGELAADMAAPAAAKGGAR
jgi:hypothetical protein